MAVNLKGEELNAITMAIRLIDVMINASTKDEEQNGRNFICLNYDIIYLDEFLN